MNIGIIRVNETSVDTTSYSGAPWQRLLTRLVQGLGGSYASKLGINLDGMESDEIFKWFLVSFLLKARIGEHVVINTYQEFKEADVLSPEHVSATSWQSLVDILDRGGYVQYNFKTAIRLQEVAWALNEKYEGDLNRLHFFARDGKDLLKKLKGLGKGISPLTLDTFLSGLRGVWEKVELPLSEPAFLAAGNLGLIQEMNTDAALEWLKDMWDAIAPCQGQFSDLEAALVRLGKNYCCRKRCCSCLVKGECKYFNREG